MAKKKKPTDDTDGKKLSFEEAIGQLEDTVSALETGQLGLTDALERYEIGVASLQRCYELLGQAERKIELLSGVDADGNPIATPLADESGEDDLQAKAGARSQRRSRKATPSSGTKAQDNIDLPGGLF